MQDFERNLIEKLRISIESLVGQFLDANRIIILGRWGFEFGV